MLPSDSRADLRSHHVPVNGVRLHCIEAGPANGPPVVLLHGFPEFWFSWRRQIPRLAEAGFRVIAPDLRGYNLSDKPSRVDDYAIENLVADVAGLIDYAGSSAALVGHDWGGVVAWHAAMWQPQRVTKLAILNAPHPAAYFRELHHWPQRLKSWYILLFQLPWLPEALLRFDDFALLRPLLDLRQYADALSQPRALHSMLNYYRAAFRRRPGTYRSQWQTIAAPTLLIWGDQDAYLVRELADGLHEWVQNLTVRHLPNATHWLQHDHAEQVSRMVIQHLREQVGDLPNEPAGLRPRR